MKNFKDRIKDRLGKNQGYLVIESAFVYPIMFFVLMFLLYMGNMYYLKAKIATIVAQEAQTYAEKFADPNLESFETSIPTSTGGSTQVTDELYRYLDVFNLGGYGKATDTEKEALKKKLEDTGFYAKMTPSNITVETHQVHNYIIYQTYEVCVKYELKFPIKFIFNDSATILTMTASEEAPVIDTPEFIRNVDMAVDYLQQSETAAKAGEKLTEAYNKLDELLNGEKKNPDEAVSGGVTTTTTITSSTQLSNALSNKCKEYYDKYGENLTDDQKAQLVKEMQEIYNSTSASNRGDVLVPSSADYIDKISYNSNTKQYEVSYKWEDAYGTVEETRKMKVMETGAMFDRVGSEYGKCVGEVGSDGSCATTDQRSIPYYFTESDITNESSYHRYVVKQDFTQDNLEAAIESSTLYTDEEKEAMKQTVKKYYEAKNSVYGDGDGLAYGEIEPMFGSSGGGYQYDMPLNMIELKNIGMIADVDS